MIRAHREALAQARAMVEPLGLTAEYQTARRHCAIVIEGRGLRYKAALSCTPRSGADTVVNYTRQKINTWLAQTGLAQNRGRKC